MSKNKKPKKLTIGKLQKLLWEECKRLIRLQYAFKSSNGIVEKWECYTCRKLITSKMDAHTGHFIPKSVCGAYLKYDLRNLRVQCMSCNIWLGGNGAVFYKHMVEREGQKYVDILFSDKNKIVRAYDHYAMLLEKYKSIV